MVHDDVWNLMEYFELWTNPCKEKVLQRGNYEGGRVNFITVPCARGDRIHTLNWKSMYIHISGERNCPKINTKKHVNMHLCGYTKLSKVATFVKRWVCRYIWGAWAQGGTFFPEQGTEPQSPAYLMGVLSIVFLTTREEWVMVSASRCPICYSIFSYNNTILV